MQNIWKPVHTDAVLFLHQKYGWIVISGDGTLYAYHVRWSAEFSNPEKLVSQPILLTPDDTVFIEHAIGQYEFAIAVRT